MKTLPLPYALTAFFGLAVLPFAAPAKEAVTLRVTPERDLIYRQGPRECVLQVELQARPPEQGRRSPVNVCVVLDRSGSMSGAKIEKARQAAGVALDQLQDDDYFSLVIYDDEAQVLIDPVKVGSRRNREALRERIDRIRPGGSTALYAGVQLGAQQVRRYLDSERVNRVILLSDGLANKGPSRTSELAALGHELRGGGMSVTTVGLGDDFNEDLMTSLAEASHANYYYVRDAEKLPGIFAQELGSAGARVAAQITLRIEVPKGVRLREVIGHPEVKSEESLATISLPELFGSERRVFHLRCDLEGGKADALDLAKVGLTYEDATAKKQYSQNQTVSIRLTDNEKEATASVQDEIAREVGVLVNRLTKEAAVRLADEGRAKEAATLLRSQAISNAAAPAAQQLPGLAEENRKLDSLADELSRTGSLGKGSRKQAQWDNDQDKYQKRMK